MSKEISLLVRSTKLIASIVNFSAVEIKPLLEA